MQHNIALFSRNGGCGYIPKPDHWKERAEEALAGQATNSTQLTITASTELLLLLLLLFFVVVVFCCCCFLLLLLLLLFLLFLLLLFVVVVVVVIAVVLCCRCSSFLVNIW